MISRASDVLNIWCERGIKLLYYCSLTHSNLYHSDVSCIFLIHFPIHGETTSLHMMYIATQIQPGTPCYVCIMVSPEAEPDITILTNECLSTLDHGKREFNIMTSSRSYLIWTVRNQGCAELSILLEYQTSLCFLYI